MKYLNGDDLGPWFMDNWSYPEGSGEAGVFPTEKTICSANSLYFFTVSSVEFLISTIVLVIIFY
jgi:hypothetical protein